MNNSKALVPKQNRIKDRGIVSTVLLYFFAALIAFITIYPMYYVLVLSFSSPREALTMRVYWWPKGLLCGRLQAHTYQQQPVAELPQHHNVLRNARNTHVGHVGTGGLPADR